MNETEIILGIAKDLGIVVKDNTVARRLLIDKINELLQYDFNKLIAILYRVDVNENKLRSLLCQQPGQDAAGIIADLLVERQIQKIRSREEFKPGQEGVSGEERW